jgi:hypothetical protein
MSNYLGEFKFTVTGCESPDALEAHLDEVLEFLDDDDRVIDADVTASLRASRVAFSLSTEAPDQVTAFAILNTSLRAAIHAAQGGTPGWEQHFNEAGARVQPAELLEA